MKKISLKNIFYSSFLFLFLFVSVESIYSQGFSRPNDWKKYRKELIFAGGASEFLGDLGGLNKVGTDFSPADVEFALTRPAFSIGYRYKIIKNMNVHFSGTYMLVKGDDKLTQEQFRNNRNLNFKSNIFEVAGRIEFSFFKVKGGNRYGIKKTLARRHKSHSQEFIGFVGIGGFYFNPKGQHPTTGQWIKLEPLHTEGQGLPGAAAPYKKYAICIPMGVAYRMIIGKLWNVGVELNYRKTFTDYIDDVSTSYYPNKQLQSDTYGKTSVIMADPSLDIIYGATANNGDGTGAQRGDKDKDSYMSLQITVGRFFPPKRGRAKLRSKF